MTRTSSALALLATLALLANGAEAQETRDCTLRPEPGGLIRGDRVPNGCVLRSEDRPPRTPGHLHGVSVIVLPDIPLFFTPGETFVVLETGLRIRKAGSARKGEVAAANRRPLPLPRARQGQFGPLFRHFGPLFRNFGRSGSAASGRESGGPASSRANRTDRGD